MSRKWSEKKQVDALLRHAGTSFDTILAEHTGMFDMLLDDMCKITADVARARIIQIEDDDEAHAILDALRTLNKSSGWQKVSRSITQESGIDVFNIIKNAMIRVIMDTNRGDEGDVPWPEVTEGDDAVHVD